MFNTKEKIMKNWLKQTWNWLLGKTTIDEKVIEDIKVTKVRNKKNTKASSESGSASAGNLNPTPNTKKRYYKKPAVKS